MNNEMSEMQRAAANIEQANELLSNSYLKKLVSTNVYAYFTSYIIIALYFTYLSLHRYNGFSFIIMLLTGLLIWTFIEYTTHRILFHFKSTHPVIKVIPFIFHGVHHAYPRDMRLSITPLIFSFAIATTYFILFKIIFGNYSEGIFTGFVLGYLLYTIIHDSTHHFSMNYPILKFIKRHHMHHHYHDTNQNFGVTSPLWDIIFGTYNKAHSTKVRKTL